MVHEKNYKDPVLEDWLLCLPPHSIHFNRISVDFMLEEEKPVTFLMNEGNLVRNEEERKSQVKFCSHFAVTVSHPLKSFSIYKDPCC